MTCTNQRGCRHLSLFVAVDQTIYFTWFEETYKKSHVSKVQNLSHLDFAYFKVLVLEKIIIIIIQSLMSSWSNPSVTCGNSVIIWINNSGICTKIVVLLHKPCTEDRMSLIIKYSAEHYYLQPNSMQI